VPLSKNADRRLATPRAAVILRGHFFYAPLSIPGACIVRGCRVKGVAILSSRKGEGF